MTAIQAPKILKLRTVPLSQQVKNKRKKARNTKDTEYEELVEYNPVPRIFIAGVQEGSDDINSC